jgi:cytochrome c556
MKNSILLAVSAGLLLSVSAFAHKGATGIVKERMDNFKASQMALKQVLAASKRNDFDAIVPLANKIKNWAEIMPTKFPSGSDGPPSEAAPAIWTDFEGFKSAAKENFQAASLLEVTALNGDAKATAKAIKQLAGTCKSCHQSYRLN